MGQAILFGLITGLALLAGALVGIFFGLSQKAVARFTAFGSGVLICALTFGLMEEAFSHGGFDAVIIGFPMGGVVFILGDYVIHLQGGRRHRRRQIIKVQKGTNAKVIAMGALLDGIPESVALGIALFSGRGRGLLMLAAIALSNFPESISSITGLRKEKFSRRQILVLWGVVGFLCLLFTVLSYVFLRHLDLNSVGILEAFAAGAILAMLVNSMMPEAYEEAGFSIGLLTVIGFLIAFILSRF